MTQKPFRITGPSVRGSYHLPKAHSFEAFFAVSLNKLSNKQSICYWLETQWLVFTSIFSSSVVPFLPYILPVSLWSVPLFCINMDDFSVWPTGSERSWAYSTLAVIDCPQVGRMLETISSWNNTANFNQSRKLSGNERGIKILCNTTLHWFHNNQCFRQWINLDIMHAILHGSCNYSIVMLCFVVVWWCAYFSPSPSGLLHWHRGNSIGYHEIYE